MLTDKLFKKFFIALILITISFTCISLSPNVSAQTQDTNGKKELDDLLKDIANLLPIGSESPQIPSTLPLSITPSPIPTTIDLSITPSPIPIPNQLPTPSTSNIAPNCPVPQGLVTCGTISTPDKNYNCSHCNTQYINENVRDYPALSTLCFDSSGTKYAMDVGLNQGAEFYLPSINGHLMEWEYVDEVRGSSFAIQRYNGTDLETGDKYFVQFHHTKSGSGNPGIHTTDKLTVAGVNASNHIHIQLASGSVSSGQNWIDVMNYLCK